MERKRQRHIQVYRFTGLQVLQVYRFTWGETPPIIALLPLSRDKMREYQRDRRARLKAEADAPVIDAAIPCDAILKAGDGELASIRAKAAAIGPGAVITKTHERLDVLSQEAFEARHKTSTPPPRSMVAIGGRPGRGLVPQGYGYPAPPDIAAASAFTKWRANTETMLATLATKVYAHEREIAALKAAQADRRADALAVVQAFAGIFLAFAIRR